MQPNQLPITDVSEAELARTVGLSREDLKKIRREQWRDGEHFHGGRGNPVMITIAGQTALAELLKKTGAAQSAPVPNVPVGANPFDFLRASLSERASEKKGGAAESDAGAGNATPRPEGEDSGNSEREATGANAAQDDAKDRVKKEESPLTHGDGGRPVSPSAKSGEIEHSPHHPASTDGAADEVQAALAQRVFVDLTIYAIPMNRKMVLASADGKTELRVQVRSNEKFRAGMILRQCRKDGPTLYTYQGRMPRRKGKW